MNIYEFAERLSVLQKSVNPHYIEELQETSKRLNAQNDYAKKVVDQFKQNYQLIEKLFLPVTLGGPFLLDFQLINQIAEMLKSKVNNLSAFEYDIEEFTKDKIEKVEIIKLADHTKSLLKKIYDKHNLIDIVDPRDFERIIAELLHDKGYEVQLTKQTRDGGYDILALKKIDGFPFKILAECKRHRKTIGIEIIRSFCDVINHEKANKGVIFTTSYYSQPAIVRQTEMGTMLDLKNRDDLIEWIIKYHKK
jgi:HJR/Mrr/RecB family endonuclease